MWPRMMAGPMVPGVGEPVYQPGLESGSSRDGTSMVPSELSPRSIRVESTPIAGTDTATGGEAGSNSGPGAGEPSVVAAGPGLAGAGLTDAVTVGATGAGDGLEIADDGAELAAAGGLLV